MSKLFCFPCALWLALACFAQQAPAPAPAAAPANPLVASEKGVYSMISGMAVAAAEKMPEESYTFKPTPEVRTFGQLVGHVADAQYMFCSIATGETAPPKTSRRRSHPKPIWSRQSKER